ncbi:NEL-type E3 ubiquitin ligase domain-containing protein [Noviherbaspirillum aerium]|uniref:NEL-type E3 ubiquitin ligase domain-containing protein n=1 Tax=Noviherbaspirillum aerium TaxID=2588497 RepID=UPI00124CD13F|nr:NEL-type E3 ubiquitin ligase domain-containing protein [Noviherbaspirillum aerium]
MTNRFLGRLSSHVPSLRRTDRAAAADANAPEPVSNDRAPEHEHASTNTRRYSEKLQALRHRGKNMGIALYASALPHSAIAQKRQADRELKRVWSRWAQEDPARAPGAPAERRGEALARVLAWRNSKHRPDHLDLTNLGLTSLPAVLPAVARLYVAGNPLQSGPMEPEGTTVIFHAPAAAAPGGPAQVREKRETLEAWQAWAAALPPDHPQSARRSEALQRVDHWYRSIPRPARLDLNGLDLAELPPRFPPVRELDLANNHFTTLPALPDSVTRLDVSHNPNLRTVGTLAGGLQELHATMVPLEGSLTLPDTVERLHLDWDGANAPPRMVMANWPAALKVARLANRQLGQLPPGLPIGCEELHLAGNALKEAPDAAFLPFHTSIRHLDLANNAIGDIAALPEKLESLNVSGNRLLNLPRIPPALTRLHMAGIGAYWLPALHHGLQELNVSGNNIESLPPLPATLRILNVASNRLQRLPQLPATITELDASNNALHEPLVLPTGLIHLNVSNNQLNALPDVRRMEGLRMLNISANEFEQLPALPEGVERLLMSFNRVEALPAELPTTLIELNAAANQLRTVAFLPPNLRRIDLSNNQLSSLPDFHCQSVDLAVVDNRLRSLPACVFALDRESRVTLSLNPIDAATFEQIQEVRGRRHRRPRLALPHIDFHPSLGQMVSYWSPAKKHDDAHEIWRTARGTEWTTFRDFLVKLHGTAFYRDPNLRGGVAEWLSRLAEDEALREQCIQLSVEALGHCDDRITLSYNKMRMAAIATDVNSGRYDQDLPAAMRLARSWFRVEELERIAYRKINEQAAAHERWRETAAPGAEPPLHRRPPDDVEIYLAYVDEFYRELDLFIGDGGMLYRRRANLTQEDFDAARRQINQAERDNFVNFLVREWAPWDALLERRDKDSHEAAHDRIDTLVSDGTYMERIRRRLLDMGIDERDTSVWNDAEARLGKVVSDEIRQEALIPLTRDFLDRNGLLHLLDAPTLTDDARPVASGSRTG